MVKIGLVGTGYINGVHARAAESVKNVSVTSVFSRSRERGKEFARRYDIENSFDDYISFLKSKEVDAVIIGLPTPLHKEYCMKAFAREKHILCEKPLALNLGDAKEIKNIALETKVKFMTAHVLRFWPEYAAAEKMIEDGKIGSIKKIYAYRFGGVPKWSSGNWLLDPMKSGGVPVDLQIHDIDFILCLLGQPEAISVAGVTDKNKLITSSSALFQYNNATAVVDAGFVMPDKNRFEMGFKIIGDLAVLDYFNLREPTLTILKNGKPPETIPVKEANPYSEQISYFAQCITNNAEPDLVSLDEAIRSLSVSLKIKSLIDKN